MNLALLSSPATLWRLIAPKNRTGLVATVCVFFGALIMLGVYRTPGTGNAGSTPRFGVGVGSSSDQLDANDPVARFRETRIGHVLIAPREGDHCQRVLFDNRTGMQYEAQAIDCSRPAAEVVASTDRIVALRKTFQK